MSINAHLPQQILKVINHINNDEIFDYGSLIFEIIEEDRKNLDYLIKLAISCANSNKLKEAKFILKCLSIKITDNIEIFYNLGLIHTLSGQYQEAIEAYNLALRINPHDIASLINKSTVHHDLKEYHFALQVADDAIKVNPQIPEAWISRGNALCNMYLFADSIESYRKACKLNPLSFEAWLNQILPLNKSGRHQEALEVCEEAIRLKPNSDLAYSNKAITLNEISKFSEAITNFNKSILFNADSPDHYYGKGVALNKLNQHLEAIYNFNKAISLRPNHADAAYQKGIAFSEMKKYEEALNCFHNAIEINSDNPNYWYSLGAVFRELSKPNAAIDNFTKTLALDPNFHAARWAKIFTLIPLIPEENEAISLSRSKFLDEINKFNEWVNEKFLDNLYKIIGLYQPFYLAYQDFSNKNIMSNYGSVTDRIMSHWQEKFGVHPLQTTTSAKIKVGIVSSFIYDHSVWHAIIKGLLINLNKDKFEIHVFHLGSVFDEETTLARSHSTSYSSNQQNLLSWARLICEKNIEVLIYPEIGMNQLTTQLANLRLSSIQIAAWGHPDTTGLKNIDYYLSGHLFEPLNAHDHYTEKLIKLPNLGSCYYRIPVEPEDFVHEKLFFESDTPVLLCPGTPFKYQAKNDWVLVEIAKRLGKCKFVFFDHQEALSNKLKFRLNAKFLASGLSIDDFIIFLPWLESKKFYGLMLKADLYLDTLDFSGFNTAIQAIDCSLPIVTKDGQFMRGRLASGILKRIGLSDLVTSNDNEFIDLAVKLVQDKIFFNLIKSRITKAKCLLYEDTSIVRDLESFLINHLRGSKQNEEIK